MTPISIAAPCAKTSGRETSPGKLESGRGWASIISNTLVAITILTSVSGTTFAVTGSRSLNTTSIPLFEMLGQNNETIRTNVRVRQALGMALDKNAVQQTVYAGGGVGVPSLPGDPVGLPLPPVPP